jgi:predicted metalloprotease with PDZ domain
MKPARNKMILTLFLTQLLCFTTIGCSDDETDRGGSEASDAAWIGVYVQELDPELKEYLDLDRNEGVIINRVVNNSPADRAGLEEEDLIVRFNRKQIVTSRDLAKAVAATSPGDKARAELIRDDKRRTVSVIIGKRPDMESGQEQRYGRMPSGHHPGSFHSNRPWLGIEMTEMADDLADYFDVNSDDGVLILSVTEDSPAHEGDIRAGDVLMEIAGDRIRRERDVFKALSRHEAGDEIEIKVRRKGRNKSLDVILGSRSAGRYGFNQGDWHEFHRDMRQWQREFRNQMEHVMPQVERELRELEHIEIPLREIEEEVRREIDKAQDQIRIELNELKLQLRGDELNNSL